MRLLGSTSTAEFVVLLGVLLAASDVPGVALVPPLFSSSTKHP